jgi:hypothetical protein
MSTLENEEPQRGRCRRRRARGRFDTLAHRLDCGGRERWRPSAHPCNRTGVVRGRERGDMELLRDMKGGESGMTIYAKPRSMGRCISRTEARETSRPSLLACWLSTGLPNERDMVNTPGPGTSGIPFAFDPVQFCFRSAFLIQPRAIMTERGRSSDL